MAQAIWRGQLTSGLLNVPVSLFSAEQTAAEVHLRMLDSRDHSPIQYKKVNSATGKEVPSTHIVKGYEYEKGHFLEIEDNELASFLPEATQSVQLENFIPREQLPFPYFEMPYYQVPQPKFEKGYVLLQRALTETDSVGVSKVVIRTKAYLSAVTPFDGALMLVLLRYPEELRSPADFVIPEGDIDRFNITAKELQMSKQLIEAMRGEWHPEEYPNLYREQLMGYVEAKLKKKAIKPAAREELVSSNVVDMMAILRQSLKEKSGKPRTKAKANAAPKKAPARRRPG